MPKIFRVTGLMSGTSLDGVDLACCEFSRKNKKWDFRILAADTIPYPPPLLSQLEETREWNKVRLKELDISLGRYFAMLINEFHKQHGLRPDLISSHGHTILHDPGNGITFQAGEGRTMADLTGITVVNDFRREDVSQGGQGAPLVPVGDRLLFGNFGSCLNLGGFANISYDQPKGHKIAFDIVPVNVALNRIARLKGLPYDKDGKLASLGIVDQKMLDRLNALEYFHMDPPKSLGREWFTRYHAPIVDLSKAEINDQMATLTEHMAIQLSNAVNRSGAQSVLVTGGGALNLNLMKRFRKKCKTRIHIPQLKLILYKEALVFALLGLMKIRGEVNCLASVTGGASDLSAGTIHSI
ncbi:MAG: anhydro-N-acetylmuramic acid kinase [Bacteroidota bacterium]